MTGAGLSGAAGASLVIDERARASVPLRALWLPTGASILSILIAGAVMRTQLESLERTVGALNAKSEQQGERIAAQAIVIATQGANILALTDRVTDLSAALRAYRAWPGEEPNR